MQFWFNRHFFFVSSLFDDNDSNRMKEKENSKNKRKTSENFSWTRKKCSEWINFSCVNEPSVIKIAEEEKKSAKESRQNLNFAQRKNINNNLSVNLPLSKVQHIMRFGLFLIAFGCILVRDMVAGVDSNEQ